MWLFFKLIDGTDFAVHCANIASMHCEEKRGEIYLIRGEVMTVAVTPATFNDITTKLRGFDFHHNNF